LSGWFFRNLLGDAWELSDEPEYKEKWASLAYRVAMDYFVYDLTH
jgi:hypothetical protein